VHSYAACSLCRDAEATSKGGWARVQSYSEETEAYLRAFLCITSGLTTLRYPNNLSPPHFAHGLALYPVLLPPPLVGHCLGHVQPPLAQASHARSLGALAQARAELDPGPLEPARAVPDHVLERDRGELGADLAQDWGELEEREAFEAEMGEGRAGGDDPGERGGDGVAVEEPGVGNGEFREEGKRVGVRERVEEMLERGRGGEEELE